MYTRPGSRRRKNRTSGKSVIRVLTSTVFSAALLATVFTSWEPASLRPDELAARYLAAAGAGEGETGEEFEAEQAKLKVGVVSGHLGLHPDTGIDDPGAVCSDGLTEAEVNYNIAELVVKGLQAAGMEADLLEEFDERLTGYQAVALVSIHADTCMYIDDSATGYKVTTIADTAVPDRLQRLEACVVNRYGRATGMAFKPGSVTRDMTEYHTFYEINSHTPAVIIETGFLFLDRNFLTENPEIAASGIVDGILCYVNNEPIEMDEGE